MNPKLLHFANKLEALSLRERAMAVLGVPVVLLMAGELLWFSPTRNKAAEAQKQAEQLQTEFKVLSATLASLPAVAPLPGADQLRTQRDEVLSQIEASRKVMASVRETIDWGTIARATMSGTPGLILTQLKTTPSELLFSPTTIKPATVGGAASSAATAAAARPAASSARAVVTTTGGVAGDAIYLHRAELTVKGDVGPVLAYVQALQRLGGGLRWDRMQLNVASYPQASVQLGLHTLSAYPETPFN
jgi:hypothetical protein